MKSRIAVCGVLTVFAALLLAQPGAAKRPRLPQPRHADDGKEDVNMLSLEIKALKTLSELDASLEQLKALQDLLKPNFIAKAKRDPAKAGATYLKNLKLLREALVTDDEDDIETYSAKVETLEEDAEVDDEVRVTPASWNAAAKDALPLFTTSQVMEHLSNYEDITGPAAVLLEALEEGIDDKGEEWEKERNAAARKVAWMAGGAVGPKVKELRENAIKWLDEKHSLKSDELEKKRSQLEKEARTMLFPKVGPTQVLTNIMIYDMAELLANPGLPAALVARIKEESKPE